eukprot:TRINITY_DN30574_c0_g1_i1.p1 TRINITY_DN30574_c0_g1~~TRINITY_DN30574_c0_g1_i1.p1  ORF type:complete len:758 (+),score=160.13 TRINITY_DN30574_c0_g1_i1:47-2275(+)
MGTRDDAERDEIVRVLELLAATRLADWSSDECRDIKDDRIRMAMESMALSVRSAALFEMSNIHEIPIPTGTLKFEIPEIQTVQRPQSELEDSLLRECPSEASIDFLSPKRAYGSPTAAADCFDDEENDPGFLALSILGNDRCLSPMVMSPREIKSTKGTVLSILVSEMPPIGSASLESSFRNSSAAINLMVGIIKNAHGTIYHSNHNQITCGWNTHEPDIQHALHAVQCGLACAGELTKIGGPGWVISAASSNLIIGQSHKSPCAIGDAVMQLPHLSSLGTFLGCHFVATESVIDILGNVIESRPVDVIHTDVARCSGPTIVIHEILGEKNSPASTNTELFSSAFRDLRLHHFKEASQTLEEIPTDRQVKRLKKLTAAGMRRAPIPNPYVRELGGWDEFKYDTSAVLADTSKSLNASLTLKYLDAPVIQNESDAIGLREAIKGVADDLLSSSSTYTSDEEDDFASHFVDTHGDLWKIADTILGCGALGAVRLGLGSNGCLVALKSLKLNARTSSPKKASLQQQLELEQIINEVSILSQLRHDNIVSYIGSGVVTGSVIICMEYVPGGSLQSLIEQFGHLPQTVIRRYAKDIMKGLKFLHASDITHYDIKPGNVLLHTDGQCKIADFGTAKLGKTEAGKIVGTPIYMSPEACRGEAEKPTDIWGLGILLCQCATGKLPFTITGDFSPFLFCRRMAKGEIKIEIPSPEAIGCPDAHDFATQCLREVPSHRPEVGILGMHPYIGK